MPQVLTTELLLSLQTPADPQLSPDGNTLAFTLHEPAPEGDKPARSAIWLVPAAGGEPRRFTNGPARDYMARFSPDGQSIAFLSNRHKEGKGKAQLYRITLAGGEAEQLTDRHAAITDFAFSPDGRRIAFLAANILAEEPKEGLTEAPIKPFESDPHTRLWLLDLTTREVLPVTPETVQIWEFAWAPGGDRLAVIASAEPHEWSWYESYVGVVDAAGGEVTKLYQSKQQVATPVFSPDGQQIAFLSSYWSDRGVQSGDLYTVPAAGGPARNLIPGWAGSVNWMAWEGERLLFLARVGPEAAVGYATPSVAPQVIWQGPVGFRTSWQPRLHRMGNLLAAVAEDVKTPPQVWVGELTGGTITWAPRSSFNPQLAEVETGEVRRIAWQNGDIALDGLLVLPPGYEPGKRYPMVVSVHGGPTGQYDYRYNTGFMGQLYAAAGLVVFQPNPRGSTGYGTAFSAANLGDMGGGDWQDIMTGVDACVAAGYADPERLGVEGWSYGGYMAAWALTQDRRFMAGVVGAGITNWLSFHGVTNIHTWDELYMQEPAQRSALYTERSPITHVSKVTAPTLIVHGEQDPCVPVGQAYEFYRGIKQQGVEVQLVVYPGEGHGVGKRKHVLDLWPRMVGWMKDRL